MGFVKLSNDLSEWAWYSDNNTLGVYIRLLIGAAWKDREYKNIHLKRGQVVTTIPKIAEENGLTVQQARTILTRLKSTGKITVENSSKFSIITLIDYDCDFENNSQNNRQITDKQQASNSQITGNQQADNRQITDKQQTDNSLSTDEQQTNNSQVTGNQQAPYINRKTESKNIRKTEIYTPPYPLTEDGENSAKPEKSVLDKLKSKSVLSVQQQMLFERFYSAYPKKVDRATAERAWAKISPKPDEAMTEKILQAVENSQKYDSRFKDRQYIPNPASWLNAKGYLNEFSAPKDFKPPDSGDVKDYSGSFYDG